MSTPPPGSPPGSNADQPPGSGPGDPSRGPGGGPGVSVSPLLPEDPPRIGDYWIDSRISASPSGVAYAAHAAASTDDTVPATGSGTSTDGDLPVIVVLLSQGAAADAAARERLGGLVNAMHIDHVLARGGQGQDTGRLGRRFVPQDDYPVSGDGAPLAPWVALRWDGGPAGAAEATDVLAAVELADLGPLGRPAGPDYRLHWIDRIKPGLARLWPLPWPGRYDRAGWVTILVSWLLMLLLAALAVLIAILIFRNEPPQSPPDPTDASASPQSGSPPPQSGSPSPQSGSPSPQSGSPSPQSGSPSSGSGSPSQSPSMSGSASGSPSASGSESGGGSPVPSDSGSPGVGNSPRSRL